VSRLVCLESKQKNACVGAGKCEKRLKRASSYIIHGAQLVFAAKTEQSRSLNSAGARGYSMTKADSAQNSILTNDGMDLPNAIGLWIRRPVVDPGAMEPVFRRSGRTDGAPILRQDHLWPIVKEFFAQHLFAGGDAGDSPFTSGAGHRLR